MVSSGVERFRAVSSGVERGVEVSSLAHLDTPATRRAWQQRLCRGVSRGVELVDLAEGVEVSSWCPEVWCRGVEARPPGLSRVRASPPVPSLCRERESFLVKFSILDVYMSRACRGSAQAAMLLVTQHAGLLRGS